MTDKQFDTFLKSMMFQVKKAETLQEVVAVLEAMCDEETVAYAEKKVDQWRKTLGKDK